MALLSIRGLRIVSGKFGLFVTWPSDYSEKHKKNFPIAFPITKALQQYAQRTILEKFYRINPPNEQQFDERAVEKEVYGRGGWGA